MSLLLAGNCVVGLTVCVISFVRHFRSANFRPGYRSPWTLYKQYWQNDQYDDGMFDLGTWSCQLSAYHAFPDDGHYLSRECIDETAALCMTPLLALDNLGKASLVWLDWRGQRTIVRDHIRGSNHDNYYS